ncbi:hypothetical protein HPK02_10960 [Anoxybacillus flavithermus]|uniref:Uncharacterized protein n=1 Tax=Anoxybacillus flavithermus TaxID=33934 RepID=A0A178TMD7_9BACL|nr:hypothetical protein [Anoxybacillus flavithermus]MBE2919381.1 hypothetical protein [Anoxybacillus flavithermus]OAO82603.1 hypothetical protein TAF16_0223 [Anoxybacillus flavithermus]
MTYNKYEEVIGFLELKILEDRASDEELEFYENYLWFGKLDKMSGTYKKLLNELKREWEGK